MIVSRIRPHHPKDGAYDVSWTTHQYPGPGVDCVYTMVQGTLDPYSTVIYSTHGTLWLVLVIVEEREPIFLVYKQPLSSIY